MGARPSGSRQVGGGDGVGGGVLVGAGMGDGVGDGVLVGAGVGDGIGDGVSVGIGREVLVGTGVAVSSGRRPHADNARLKDATSPNLRKSRREIFFDLSSAIAYSFWGYATQTIKDSCGSFAPHESLLN